MEQLADGYGLVEAPLWLEGRGLLFADAVLGGVYCLDAAGEVSTVVPHRRGIGGMVLHTDGGVVVSGRNLSHKRLDGDGTTVLLDLSGDGVMGFNDITTDAAGRIYAGSLRYYPTQPDTTPQPGELYAIDTDGRVRCEVRDVVLSNGLGFSPDGSVLYHSDSERRTVFAATVDQNGSLSDRRAFATLEAGIPDGLAVAADGTVWVAAAHDGAVLVYAPAGQLVERIDVPIPMVTSVCFGGSDLSDLYIVTGSEGSDRGRAGAVLRTRAPVAGLAVPPARVALDG